MSPAPQELEAKLGALRPSPLDGLLLARLEDAANGSLTTLGTAEAQLEISLRRIQPTKLPPAFMAALEATLGAAATVEPSIIPFPNPANGTAGATRHDHRAMLSAAAAVALLGAAAALFTPGKSPQQTSVAADHSQQASPPTSAPASPLSQNFVPAAFNTGLSQASDEGVLWQAKDQPRRVVKVIYWDRVTFVNPQGNKIECETPRVEYILVPEKID